VAAPVISRFLPAAASAHAASLDQVLTAVHLHIAVQAIAWGAFFVFCLVRFRRGAGRAVSHEGMRPTLPVLAIGLVIAGDAALLAGSALPAWFRRSDPPPTMPVPIEVRVVAEQFAWNIHYPGPDRTFGRTSPALINASNPLGIDRADAAAQDDVGLLNTLMLPVGHPVIVYLTARDVIHSFTLNEMRVKQDATPGLVVRTWFTPIRTGHWEIACSQLCGLGHYRMRGEYRVMAEDEWNRWLASEVALVAPVRR
jgi:cytochrome c oxidase subunit 2